MRKWEENKMKNVNIFLNPFQRVETYEKKSIQISLAEKFETFCLKLRRSMGRKSAGRFAVVSTLTRYDEI